MTTSGSNSAGSFPILKALLWIVAISIVLISIYAVTELTPLLPIAKGLMSIVNGKLAWYFTRAGGIVAYILLTISMAWGLILSTKISKEYTPAPAVLALHNAVSWVAIAIGMLHALALMMDTYYTYSLFDILIPFIGPYRAGWVGLGILSLYTMFVSSASFAWITWLGQRGWRMIHYTTFPMFGLATLHGLMAGTDSWHLGTTAMYASSTLLVLFLINYRILASKGTSTTRRRIERHLAPHAIPEESSVSK